jgi:hypothetical protein
MAATQSLSDRQFALAMGPPPDPSATLAGKGDQIDTSWADRDIDPALGLNAMPGPTATLSQSSSIGYGAKNFKT